MKKILSILAAILVVGSMWADQVSWDLVNGGTTCSSASADEVVFSSSYATMSVTKNGGTAANNYLGGSGTKVHTRFYNNNIATFTPATGYQISSIVVACDGSYTSYWTTSANQTNCTTSVSNDDLTITPTVGTTACSIKLTGTTRVKTVTINYSLASNDPQINASDVTIEDDATSGEIAYTITNPADAVDPTAAITTGDWISNVAVNTAAGKVTFDATANTNNIARTATITISYTGANDKVVTITQKKHITTVTYDKVSDATMVIGGTYVWYAQKNDGTGKSVATPLGGNTYFGAGALANESSVAGNTLSLTSETPELFIFNQVGESTWTIEDADNAGKYLYISGDKKLAWNTTKNEWTLSGTTQPTFACSTHNSTAYTMFANLGSTRFCAYTAKNSNQDAILYHLASESVHTLSCVIDNETTKTYNIKDGYIWTLLTPEKDGAVFLGWATAADGEVVYADGADYTMPVANATLYAKWRQQTVAPVFTTDLNAAYNCNKGGAAVTLTIVATDADSYQWYKNATATTAGATAIVGATEASYDYAGTTIGTEYVYCVATNAIGSTNSSFAAVTTKGSNLAVLSHIEFSNGFDAFLKNNTITAYYMAGEIAPSVNESSIVISEGADYDIDGNTLTILAEDGETMVDYTIVLSAVTPNTTAADEVTFDGTETWIKTGNNTNGNGFDGTKGWVFSKNVEDNTPRISEGRNRQYWFVGPATEFTLINTGVTSARNIKVYVNGVEQSITSVPKNDANPNSITITGLSAVSNNMVAIVSNNTGGDGGFTKYTFTPVAPAPVKTIDFYAAGLDGYYTTFSNDKAVSFPTSMDVDGEHINFTVYGVAVEGDALVIYEEEISATVDDGEYYLSKDEGYLILAETTGTVAYTGSAVISVEYTELDDYLFNAHNPFNELHPASETKDGSMKYYMLAYSNESCTPASLGFYWGADNGDEFDSRENSAYLAIADGSLAPAHFLFVDETDVVTSVENVESAESAVKFFENGNIRIMKNGVVYNVLGTIVR